MKLDEIVKKPYTITNLPPPSEEDEDDDDEEYEEEVEEIDPMIDRDWIKLNE